MRINGKSRRSGIGTEILALNTASSAQSETQVDVPDTAPVERLTLAVSSTGDLGAQPEETSTSLALHAARVYPHLFDQAGAAGQAVSLLSQAVVDVRAAMDAFDVVDLESVATQFRVVAATAAKAHEYSDFNRSFGSVVGFVRRATLVADASEVSRPALNALIQVLRALVENPALGLSEAARLTEKLADEGWRGEHQAVEALLRVLLDETLESDQGLQGDLFALLTEQL